MTTYLITTTTNPTISLTPIYSDIVDTVSLVPLQQQILMNPTTIYYDPYRTFDYLLPNIAYYTSYPDLNTDTNIQARVAKKIWKLLANEWIFEYLKIFRYVKGKKGSYSFVDSVEEANENTSTGDEEDKAEWLLLTFYKKSNLMTTVDKYRIRAGINWWDVDNDDNIDRLKDFIYNQIRRKIMEKIA